MLSSRIAQRTFAHAAHALEQRSVHLLRVALGAGKIIQQVHFFGRAKRDLPDAQLRRAAIAFHVPFHLHDVVRLKGRGGAFGIVPEFGRNNAGGVLQAKVQIGGAVAGDLTFFGLDQEGSSHRRVRREVLDKGLLH